MSNLNVVSSQWSTRPYDQRYETVDALYEAVKARRLSSTVRDVALEHLRVAPLPDGDLSLGAATGESYGRLTNWSFGQLCQRAHAPAGYLRALPAELAAINVQWSLENGLGSEDNGDGKVLSRVNGTDLTAAVTSPTYGRIWDHDVVAAIRDRVDLTAWKVPAASYAAHDPKRATTLYASDRDVFVFLVNESAVIETPEGPKYRGFYVYNSEVGSATFGLATMLYDYVCDNRIIWGVSGFKEIKIRHTSGAPMRFMAEAAPSLRRYLEASPTAESETIKAAMGRTIGKDRASVVDWMRTRGFSQALAGKAYDGVEREGVRNPRSLWGVVSGLTGMARDVKNTDDRVDLERKASGLLDLVSAE